MAIEIKGKWSGICSVEPQKSDRSVQVAIGRTDRNIVTGELLRFDVHCGVHWGSLADFPGCIRLLRSHGDEVARVYMRNPRTRDDAIHPSLEISKESPLMRMVTKGEPVDTSRLANDFLDVMQQISQRESQ